MSTGLTRARENLVFIAAANLAGDPKDPGGATYNGHSLICGPDAPVMARVLAEADGTGMAVATIDFSKYDHYQNTIAMRSRRARGGEAAFVSRLVADEYEALANAEK